MQLLDEPEIRLGNSSLAFDVLHGFSWRPVILGHQERGYNADASANSFCTMHKHPSLRISCESVFNPSCCRWEVSGEFGERKILHPYLQTRGLNWEEGWGWLKNFVREGGQNMGNFVLGKTDGVLCEREVRDVESWNDLRRIAGRLIGVRRRKWRCRDRWVV